MISRKGIDNGMLLWAVILVICIVIAVFFLYRASSTLADATSCEGVGGRAAEKCPLDFSYPGSAKTIEGENKEKMYCCKPIPGQEKKFDKWKEENPTGTAGGGSGTAGGATSGSIKLGYELFGGTEYGMGEIHARYTYGLDINKKIFNGDSIRVTKDKPLEFTAINNDPDFNYCFVKVYKKGDSIDSFYKYGDKTYFYQTTDCKPKHDTSPKEMRTLKWTLSFPEAGEYVIHYAAGISDYDGTLKNTNQEEAKGSTFTVVVKDEFTFETFATSNYITEYKKYVDGKILCFTKPTARITKRGFASAGMNEDCPTDPTKITIDTGIAILKETPVAGKKLCAYYYTGDSPFFGADINKWLVGQYALRTETENKALWCDSVSLGNYLTGYGFLPCSKACSDYDVTNCHNRGECELPRDCFVPAGMGQCADCSTGNFKEEGCGGYKYQTSCEANECSPYMEGHANQFSPCKWDQNKCVPA